MKHYEIACEKVDQYLDAVENETGRALSLAGRTLQMLDSVERQKIGAFQVYAEDLREMNCLNIGQKMVTINGLEKPVQLSIN